MLTYAQHLPAQPRNGAPLVILLHGRGSHEQDLLGLYPGLPADVILVTPRAPFPGGPWGYGDGFAWYRYLGGTTPDAASFERSLEELDAFLTALPARLPVKPGPTILGGFSQGGTTALGYALTHRAKVDGLLMFSGFLARHPAVDASLGNAARLPVFWGHGTSDPMIPFQRGVEGRRALLDAGAAVTTGDYPIGHAIDQQELADAAAWLDALRTEPEPAR